MNEVCVCVCVCFATFIRVVVVVVVVVYPIISIGGFVSFRSRARDEIIRIKRWMNDFLTHTKHRRRREREKNDAKKSVERKTWQNFGRDEPF